MEGAAAIDALNEAGLDNQMRIIVEELAKVYPRSVGKGRLIDALWGLDPNGGPDNPDNVLAARISVIRGRLQPLGWTIPRNMVGRGIYGRYRLEQIA